MPKLPGILTSWRALAGGAARIVQRPRSRPDIDALRDKAIIDSALIGILLVNAQGEILRANPAMERLSGYEAGELPGIKMEALVDAKLRWRHQQQFQRYFAAPERRTLNRVADLNLLKKDGSLLPVDISLGYWEDEGQFHVAAYVTDITHKLAYEKQLRHQATHDELTGLPNRWLFMDRLRQALEQARRSGDSVAVMLLDLDNFKIINDSYGHSTGDEFLREVTQWFVKAIRAEDTIARLGGDEFAIFLPRCDQPEDATRVAAKLIASFQEPVILSARTYSSSVSIGIAFFPQDANTDEDLLRLADLAMYQAKNSGRGNYTLFSAELNERVNENAMLLPRLKAALESDRLELQYQPQVSLSDNTMNGAEALLRWNEPGLGFISPARFIPLAEASGLILPMDRWVIDRACRQIREWTDAGLALPLAVNISAQQFGHADLAELVEEILRKHGTDPSLLELEITETAAMHDPRQAAGQLERLIRLGIKVTLDDFGTGYSSLAYLKRLPIAKIKIDGRFVRDITQDSNDVAIVQSIIALARTMDLQVLAECVESQAQYELLKSYGCDSYQGYHFSPPVSASAFRSMLVSLS